MMCLSVVRTNPCSGIMASGARVTGSPAVGPARTRSFGSNGSV